MAEAPALLGRTVWLLLISRDIHHVSMPASTYSRTISGTSSPSTRSPVKSKSRREDSPHRPEWDPDMDVSGPQASKDSSFLDAMDSIDAFLSLGKPISDTMYISGILIH